MPNNSISPLPVNLSAALVAPVAEGVGPLELEEPLAPDALASVGTVSLAF